MLESSASPELLSEGIPLSGPSGECDLNTHGCLLEQAEIQGTLEHTSNTMYYISQFIYEIPNEQYYFLFPD